MQRTMIRRGGILSAGYDRSSRELEIEFDTHRIMRYKAVSESIARRLIASQSPMSHFRDEIEGEYSSYEVMDHKNKTSPDRQSGDALKALFGQ